jgi:hypothetical protein
VRPAPTRERTASSGTLVLGRRLVVLQRLDQRLSTRECSFETPSLVSRDSVREEAGIDAEPRRDPFDRLAGRARLAALDLGDVLLREALARELALGQAGGHPELAQPLTQAQAAGGPTVRGGAAGVGEGGVSGHSGKVK